MVTSLWLLDTGPRRPLQWLLAGRWTRWCGEATGEFITVIFLQLNKNIFVSHLILFLSIPFSVNSFLANSYISQFFSDRNYK